MVEDDPVDDEPEEGVDAVACPGDIFSKPSFRFVAWRSFGRCSPFEEDFEY